jgi:type IV secretory pathway TraG/TraD family ATPase VirD4
MVNFLLDHILKIREEMKYPVTMLLDEFTNFGKIQGIGDTLSIIRKNEIGLILGFQNHSQLEQVYSRTEAKIIIDQPATQVYFKQKTFKEARDLSEAIGRTTVEEATVSDSGRVQEFVHGRQLITPDELISLNKEVIIFTADTKPLRLPLTEPLAYEQALSYDSPTREKHEVSDYIRKRGRTAKDDEERIKPHLKKGRQSKGNQKFDPRAKSDDRSDRGGPKKQDKEDEEERTPYPKRPQDAPDYDP